MRGRRDTGESGQASSEWLALVLVVALLVVTLAALGARVPGAGLAQIIASRIACAAGLGSGCGGHRELAVAFGPELAGLVTAHAPRLAYEEGMRAVPVDFRRCREDPCAEGAAAGPVRESLAGEPATAFVHVVDCRDPAAAGSDGFECGGSRAGRVYLQYWLYYPGSATARALLGDRGAHPDDWESFQVRIAPDGGAEARASSHHGYNGTGGDWLSDAGLVAKAGWTESTGVYAISGGSHAGRVGRAATGARWTAPGALRLIPMPDPAETGRHSFAVSPPWRKRVYRDPEYRGTD